MQTGTDRYRQQPYAGDAFRHGIVFRREHPELPHEPDPVQLDQLSAEQTICWQTYYAEHGQKIGLDDTQRYNCEWQKGFQTSEEQDFPRPRQEMTVNALPLAKLLLSGLCAVQFSPAHTMYYGHHSCVHWPDGTKFSTPYGVDYWRGPLVIDVLLPSAHQFPGCCPYMLWQPENAGNYGTTPPASNWDLHIGKAFPSYEEMLWAIRSGMWYVDRRQQNVFPCQQSACYAIYSDTFSCTSCGDFACLEHRSGSLCIRCIDYRIKQVTESGCLHSGSGLYLL